MKLCELESVINAAGGGQNALDYASALLEKINRLEFATRYSALLKQLFSAKEQGDFRGRLLEVSFADRFESKGINLQYGAKQDRSGDIDFLWQLDGLHIYIELKHLGQDSKTRNAIDTQLKDRDNYAINLGDGLKDIARIQYDLIDKASTRKFNPKPDNKTINLVAIDVSELQLKTVDTADCALATGGNSLVEQCFDALCLRPPVVGVFENPTKMVLSREQCEWLKNVQRVTDNEPHPRTYIHGALFLFREPNESAAICYDLKQVVVWNADLVNDQLKAKICTVLRAAIPFAHGIKNYWG